MYTDFRYNIIGFTSYAYRLPENSVDHAYSRAQINTINEKELGNIYIKEIWHFDLQLHYL